MTLPSGSKHFKTVHLAISLQYSGLIGLISTSMKLQCIKNKEEILILLADYVISGGSTGLDIFLRVVKYLFLLSLCPDACSSLRYDWGY